MLYLKFINIGNTSTIVKLKVSIMLYPPGRPSKHVYNRLNIYFNNLSRVIKCPLNKSQSNNIDNSL